MQGKIIDNFFMSEFPNTSFTILITTRNRLEELKFTLNSLQPFIKDGISVMVCDDASTDGTSEFIRSEYPEIQLSVNLVNKGLIFSRNLLMNQVQTPYAISLDDDANFLSLEPLGNILRHFEGEPKCGVIAFRIFWGKKDLKNFSTNDKSKRVKGFVGCGHAWRMNAWHSIPDYPEWFEFYGEEEFAGYHLYLNNWQIVYLPEVLVHHRVDLKSRKKDKDYTNRLRKSLRAGWYLYLIFIPLRYIPKKMQYSIWMQLKLKVFKGDGKAFVAILMALGDIVLNCGKIYRNTHRFSKKEWQAYFNLDETQIYWNP